MISRRILTHIIHHQKFSFMKTMCIEISKRIAAYKAVDEWVKTNTSFGIGSGSAVIYAVDRIRERVLNEQIIVHCVPTSFQARQLIVNNGLTLGDLETHPILDCVIDGADEVDDNLTLIKGGGGCLLQEKIVTSCAKSMIVIADYTKDSVKLGDKYLKGFPIEVVPMAYVPIKNKAESMFGGSLNLRMAVAKAGTCITDNGNFTLDWHFTNQSLDWSIVNREILVIPGVVEIGLFVNMATKVYFVLADGTVKER